jgi:hypothetical protein
MTITSPLRPLLEEEHALRAEIIGDPELFITEKFA